MRMVSPAHFMLYIQLKICPDQLVWKFCILGRVCLLISILIYSFNNPLCSNKQFFWFDYYFKNLLKYIFFEFILFLYSMILYLYSKNIINITSINFFLIMFIFKWMNNKISIFFLDSHKICNKPLKIKFKLNIYIFCIIKKSCSFFSWW